MPGKKCPQCGLVNFAEASHCLRCAIDFGPAGEVSTDESRVGNPTSNPTRLSSPKQIYLVGLGLGFLLELVYFVFELTAYPDRRSNWFLVVLGIIYAAVAGCLSARHRVRAWLVSVCLSVFYLLGWGLALSELLRSNQKYGGMFWSAKFYWSPILLVISIPLAVFLGGRFGSKRSLLRFAALVSVFVAALAAVPLTETKSRPAKELNYSTEILAPEFAMRLELQFYLEITDDPMFFRTFPTPPPVNRRGGWNVTILRKGSTFSPAIHMTMNVDGKELESSMWPINAPDGGSHIDFSQKQDYSHILNWSVGPNPDLLGSLVNAHHITLTWGNVTVDLSDEQVESLRTFVRNWGRLLHDEGMLCTNPMCQQGDLNR